MELIPGLPNDLARECLVRVSYEHFATIASVSNIWKSELESADFCHHRKSTQRGQVFIVLAVARPNPNSKLASNRTKHYLPPVYRPVVFEPLSNRWAHLPPPPTTHNVVPLFCRFATVRSGLVVVGGFDMDSWEVVSWVYIYSFLSNTWRRGVNMPGPERSFFCCASDGERVVYVAGGHDKSKKALRSAMTYDVETDAWAPMPDMGLERDECKAIFRDGKFHVISGYATERQGRFSRSVQVFDPVTWRWGPVVDNVLEPEMSVGPTAFVDGTGDEYMYTCQNGNLVALRGPAWQSVEELPTELVRPLQMMRWQGKMTIFGAGIGKCHVGYTLDFQSGTWTKVEAPEEFSGQIMEGTSFAI